MTRRFYSPWVIGSGAILLVVSMFSSGAGAVTAATPGGQGTDTALPATPSAVTVNGRGEFASLAINVNQTASLTNTAGVASTTSDPDPSNNTSSVTTGVTASADLAITGPGTGKVTLTRNVAASVMRNRVRLNGLNIGWMDTPGEDRIMKTYHEANPDWLKNAEAGRPFGRLLKPAEVARTVAFLSSEESGLMTGSIIDFDQQVLGAAESSPEPPPALF